MTDALDSLVVRLALLAAALLAAVVVGWWLRRRDGHDRSVDSGDVLTPADLGGAALGARATLLQVSSAFCAPCRQTRSVLERLAAATEGVAHVEVDAADHLDLVRRLDVRRTPTVLVLDGAGRVVRRASGAPTPAQAASALAAAVPELEASRG
ncbi:MAG: TlpA family protein disulfide reductase [Actinomycetes bacterium]